MIPKNKEVRFETTNLCQYKCVICNNGKLTRPRQTMSVDDFTWILDKITALTDQYKIVSFAGIGEPLMDASIVAKVGYAKALRFKPIMITNAGLLTPEKFQQLQKAGLYSIRISFHGATPESYARLHGVDPIMYNKVKENLLEIFKMRRTTKVLMTCVIAKGVNSSDDIQSWIDMWSDKADLCEVWRAHNWINSLKFRDKSAEKKRTCGRVDNGPLQIQVDGSVNACCFDYDNQLVYGNIYSDSLHEIFNGERYKALLKAHTESKVGKYICKNCDQRHANKDDTLIYSSKYDIAERIKQTSTGYDYLET